MNNRYFLELAYDGKDFCGWQIQPNGDTVQERIQSALSQILKAEIKLVGAGRTDAGVHAKQMFAHFDAAAELDKASLIKSLNGLLPKSIAIYDLFRVKPDVSSRFQATRRTYQYIISQEKNPFWQDRAYEFHAALDVDKMNEAAAAILDYSDFECFCKANAQNHTNLCKVSHAHWSNIDGLLVFEISADRFLRNMVRAIVGTLVEIGRGKMPASEIHQIIKSKDRGKAGYSVPAHGLYLTNIAYPEDITL